MTCGGHARKCTATAVQHALRCCYSEADHTVLVPAWFRLARKESFVKQPEAGRYFDLLFKNASESRNAQLRNASRRANDA